MRTPSGTAGKVLFGSVMLERFLDAEIAFWTQGFRPAYLEQKITNLPLTLSDGRTVELRAKIDRIDADDKGNFLIVDYKTGKYPSRERAGNRTSSAAPLCRHGPTGRGSVLRGAATARRPGILRPGRKFGDAARDVVLYDRDAGLDHPPSSPRPARKARKSSARSCP